MLARGEIDFMVLSHWHLDHFWGIEFTLKHNPQLKIYAPATWREEDRLLLQEKGNIEVEDHDGRPVSICRNGVPHEGELVDLTRRRAKTAAASTACCRAWRCGCSIARCYCR